MKKFIKQYWILLLSLLVVFFGIPFLFSFLGREVKEEYGIFLLIFYSSFAIISNFILSYYKKSRWDIPLILFFISILSLVLFNDQFFNFLVLIILVLGYLGYFLGTLFSKNNKYVDSKEKPRVTKFRKIVFNGFVPFFIFLTLENYYRLCTFKEIYLPYHIQSFLFALFLIIVIYTLFLFISGSTFKANIIFAILFIIIFVVNQVRIFYTNDTLMFTDLMFLNSGGDEIGKLMDATLVNAVGYLLVPTLISVLLIAWQCVIGKRYNLKIHGWKRMAVSLVAVFLLSILFLPINKLDRKILKLFYNTSNPKDYAIAVSNTRYYRRFGVLSGMYGKYLEFERYKPDGYSEDKLNKILTDSPKNNGNWGNPNIIVIFSESFWDVTRINGITFDKDVISNFHHLKNSGHVFEMITPSYGGISANVEYEILTGGSLDYFGKGYIPYMQLYKDGKSKNNPSIIKELNNNGYMTKILNASSSTMFNCDKVYELMGVKERRHIYNERKSADGYVSDEYITDQIIKEFSMKDKEEMLFYMAITMGGHMPYYPDKYSKYDINITDSMYDDDTTRTILSYAQGIYNADQQLGRLYDYINTLDENTIIVFFGDHLPFIQNKKGEDALEKVNYFDHNDDLESIYKRFNTEALVVSNYDIPFDDTKYISPDMLLTYVINNMNLSISPYYSWLYNTKDVFGSSNYVITQTKDGKFHYTRGLEGEAKKVFNERAGIQYMLFN